MSIGIDGQFYLSVNLGGNSDFIQVEDLIELSIYEYAGNILPTFELSFRSYDESIFKFLNEGNSISIQIGRTSGESEDVKLFPSSLDTAKDGANARIYKVSGFAASTDYITNHNTQITSMKSAIEVAIATASNSFPKVVSNITKSKDKQKWIQPSISDKQFLNDVILRSDLGSSFPVFAITSTGSFIINDLEKLLEAKFNWKLTKDKNKDNDIVYDSDVTIESQAGFINNWIGYGKELNVIDSVSGDDIKVFEDPKVIMSMSNTLDKSQTIKKRFGGSRFISDNVSSTYWSAYNHNLQSLANLSKIDNTLSFTDEYYPVKVLDIVMFNEESNSNDKMSGEEQSGLYIISGVIRTFQAKRMSTVLILNREAFNNVRNA